MRRLCLLWCVLGSVIGGSNAQAADKTPPSRAAIQKELTQAEKDFQDAKSMFNPWYTGPLLAPSPHLISPGLVNIQPYLFITGNFGRYTNSGKYESMPTLFNVNPQFIALVGVTQHMEFTLALQADYNSQSHESSFNFADMSAGLGFQIIKEGPYIPALLFSVQESFPTGKYRNLNPNKGGVDATGSGTFGTTIALNFGKIVWWWIPKHPMNFRLSVGYTFPTMVHVEGFNAYGGGYGTNGHVHPGQSLGIDFGYEYSFTQRWAGALDVVYKYSAASHFSGDKGVDATGAPAVVGGPFSEQLSLAPAIEYNWNENLGFIGGVWFTVWGRNSLSFVSGILSVTYTF